MSDSDLSPLAIIRRRHGMSVTEFALALGVAAGTVAAAESGERLAPRKLILSLALLTGCDPTALQAEYSAWRAARAAGVRARLQEAR